MQGLYVFFCREKLKGWSRIMGFSLFVFYISMLENKSKRQIFRPSLIISAA